MITRITKANADKYRVLFADAVEALQTHDINGNPVGSENFDRPVIEVTETYEEVKIKEEEYLAGEHYIWNEELGDWELTALDAQFIPEARYAILVKTSESISTLEEYFCHIADLQAINKKFTVLPLDEELFYFNANTRAIEAPKDFKTNGVAVVGDEVAEILYFKVDRFFDMDDLAEKDIFVQWRAPADKDGNRKEGVSVPWISSTEILPGYIVFGWPLSSELTATPGKIDFSVRFYTHNIEEKKIVYSLSSLMSNVDVKEGLNYDLEQMLLDETNIIKAENLILNRLVNSSSSDENAPDPEEPVIIEDLLEAFNFEKQEPNDEGKHNIYNVYLTDTVTGDEAPGFYRVQATTNDAGIIAYTWIKKDPAGELQQDSLVSNYVFVEVNDEERDMNKVYYVKKDEDVYTPYTFTEELPTLEDVKNEGIQLYERFSQVVINAEEDIQGTYQVRVSNRVGRKIARTYGDIVMLQGPVEPEITKDIDESGKGQILDSETYMLEVSAEASVDEHAYNQYLIQKLDAEGEYETVAQLDEPNYVIVGSAYGAEETENGDGYYRFVVESKLNGEIKLVEGEAMRVTHSASPVAITISEPTLTGDNYDINKPISITVEVNEFEQRTEEDTITYQWYRYAGDNLAEELEAGLNGNHVVTDKDIKVESEDADKASITIPKTEGNDNGYYFCEVINTYNGTQAKKCSKFFHIVDSNE